MIQIAEAATCILFGLGAVGMFCVGLLRDTGRRKRWRRWSWILMATGLVSPFLGTFSALYLIVGSRAEMDPSEKATMLARGISEGVSCAAYIVAALLVLGFAVLGRRLVARLRASRTS